MKANRILAVLTAVSVLAALISGCSSTPQQIIKRTDSITVVTTYGGDDGNRDNYLLAIKEYEALTGVKVLDSSQTSDESFKQKISLDFVTGSEPDVLFFFTGADADSFIRAGKVVPIEEIRSLYPDYASNMKDELLPLSTFDKLAYAVPVNGFWEGLFVNRRILSESGVSFPGADYTWDQFLEDCEKIKQAGYIPIDLSISGTPHYWWEYAVMNNGSIDNQLDLCESSDDAVGQKWIAAIDDIKQLYRLGYLPPDTLTTTGSDPHGSGGYFRINGSAAFTVDGSWYLGGLEENIKNGTLYGYTLDDFGVTYVPAKGDRKPTEIIAGISSGYYITRRAWEDSSKRDAVVKFVSHMTADSVVLRFASGTPSLTALKSSGDISGENPLRQSALDMCAGVTGSVGAVQDIMGDEKARLFSQLHYNVSGQKSAEDVLRYAIGG